MGLVTEERAKSGLNPDAPLFIPAAMRQVEDFSPEWWQLVTTSAWYRDYWLSQHQDDDGGCLFSEYDDVNNIETENAFDYDCDVADLLPDGDDLFQELALDYYEAQLEDINNKFSYAAFPSHGLVMDAEAEVKNLSSLELEETGPKFSTEPAKDAVKLVN